MSYNEIARQRVIAPGRRLQVYAATYEDCNINWRRFFSKIDITPTCWLWTGTASVSGYGQYGVRLTKGGWRLAVASRLSFKFFNGSIPELHHICHRCDVPLCVNPAHLFAASPSENQKDAYAKERKPRNAGESNHKAWLTEEIVREMRAEFGRGKTTIADLARKYGYNSGSMWKLLHGKIWTCCDDEEGAEA